jgi:hypothetical protein
MEKTNKFEEEVFWKNGWEGECKGGIHFRSYDLNKFIKKLEASENGGEVIGIKFEDNNLELIINTNKE